MKEITAIEAEKIVGLRLDRRKKYATTENGKTDGTTGAIIFELAKWTSPCSGCSCECEYGCEYCGKAGGGCHECGYTGKRRNSFWVPAGGTIDDCI